MAMNTDIVKFAAGSEAVEKFFAKAKDFEMQKFGISGYDTTKTLNEKNEKLNEAFMSAVEERAGVTRESAKGAWMSHPSVKWAAMSLVEATINTLLPITVFPQMGEFVDLRTAGYGDVVHFKVMPRELFTVSIGAHGERTSMRQKNFKGDIVVSPIEHIITVFVDMYSVLAGKEDIGEFIRLAIVAMQTKMGEDAVIALNTGLSAATYPAELVKTGAFNAATLITLAETVEAANYGQKPIIMGTAAALAKVLPDSTAGFRAVFEGNGGTVDVMKDFYGYDLVRMRQFLVPGSLQLVLNDDVLYILSPAADKLIKAVVTNELTNGNDFYDNADLTSNFTMRKDWGMEFASAARAGMYTITD